MHPVCPFQPLNVSVWYPQPLQVAHGHGTEAHLGGGCRGGGFRTESRKDTVTADLLNYPTLVSSEIVIFLLFVKTFLAICSYFWLKAS